MATLRLPLPVVLDIVYFCDIPTLKCLRLAHRSMRDLIDTYQVSICSNASDRFFEKEEIDSFQLLDKPYPTILTLFALEYRVRTAKWLAAVGLENKQEDATTSIHGNIGANEAQGDTLRGYVTVGLSVLWRLADIARNLVYEMPEIKVSESRKRVSSLTRGSRSVQKLEATIKEQQLEYISSLPYRGRDSIGYLIMHGVISHVFVNRVFEDPRSKTSDWQTGNEYAYRNSWLNWLVLREGPNFFVRAWSSKEGNEECLRHITMEWSKRSKKQVLIEHSAAKEVEESLLRTSNAMNEGLRYCALNDWAKSGREIERVFSDISFHLGRRLSRDAIRSIEQEYSDYSS